jgi:hypothetical protein
MKLKSVQSIHPCKSVIQTFYDIVKAHGGELKVETLSADLSDHNVVKAEAAAQAGNERVGIEFIIILQIKSGSI